MANGTPETMAPDAMPMEEMPMKGKRKAKRSKRAQSKSGVKARLEALRRIANKTSY